MADEKENKKCICCLVLGIILVVVGLSADIMGWGASPAFGYKQIAAVVVGIILIFLGTKSCKCGDICKIGKKQDK